MRTIRTIFRRQLAATFQNPGVYVVAGLFLFLVSSLVVHGIREYAARSTARGPAAVEEAMDYTQMMVSTAFGSVSLLFVFVIPILTMRAFAEERRSGTFELLATWPIRDWELILGKYLALVAVTGIIGSLMSAYVVVYYLLGHPDTGVIVSAAVGLALISMACVAFGLFASALTENQIIAAIVTFAGLFFFWIIQNLGGDATTLFSRICEAASMSLHFSNFVKGDVRATDVAYFVVFPAFWLFLTARALETRHWK